MGGKAAVRARLVEDDDLLPPELAEPLCDKTRNYVGRRTGCESEMIVTGLSG